ncbi:MAG: hypothetical protein H6Q89_1417 [Myxococcaceae bacterium]|nr:hypothetical protein [Myxococcaceae bacterium]
MAEPVPEGAVRRYLDAGITAKLNLAGALGWVLFFGLGAAVTALLASNRDLRPSVPYFLVGLVGLYAGTFGRLVGSANREGVRRRLGLPKRWATLNGKRSRLETRRSRNNQGRVHLESFQATTWDFASGSFSFSDRFLRNGKELEVFAAIAAAHAQPAKFGDELQTEASRAALAAFAALPASRQGPQRPVLAGARPWIVGVLALGLAGMMGNKAQRAWGESNEPPSTAYGPISAEAHLADTEESRARAKHFGINAGLAGLVGAAAITAGVLGQRAHRRRRASP